MPEDPTTEDPLIVGAPPGAPTEGELVGEKTTSSQHAAAPEPPKTPLGKRLLKWLLILSAVVALLLFGYRWAGTSTIRGTVQRVYEDEARHRVEFVAASGEVLVFENEPLRFPHFKSDTTDLQAKLHRYSETGDIVDVTTWGFRAAWFSVYPNAVDVEFILSDAVRKKRHIDHLTQSVIDELIDQGVLERGEGSERMRPGLKRALEKGMDSADSKAAPDTRQAPEESD